MYRMTHHDRIAYCMACVEDVLETIGPSFVGAIEKSLYAMHPGIHRSLNMDVRRLTHYLRLYAPPRIRAVKWKNEYNIYHLEGQDYGPLLESNPIVDFSYHISPEARPMREDDENEYDYECVDAN